MFRLSFPILAVLFACGAANATQSVALPPWVCAHPDAVFVSAFEAGENAVPHRGSGGSGGAYPGNLIRWVYVADLGSGAQPYYVYVPDAYTPSRPWPLLVGLHGVAPYASVYNYARDVSAYWSGVAQTGDFIVVAPVANNVIYDSNSQPYAVSWLVPPSAGPNDYDMLAAILADMQSAYNIELSRIYGWGFSAGGHVMHDLGVSTHSTALNASTLAAYGVSAGDLSALACASISNAACDQLLSGLSRKVPVDLRVGNADPNLPYVSDDYSRFVADGWSAGQNVFYSTFTGAHTYSTADLQAAWTHLCPNAVVP